MQTTLRLEDALYREAKADAARQGLSLTKYLEEAIRMRLLSSGQRHVSYSEAFAAEDAGEFSLRETATTWRDEVAERDALMEALLRRTAHFQLGAKATREEMNER